MPTLSRRAMLATAFAVSPSARVAAEEVVYEFTPANNGAGPLWCYGAPTLVRYRDTVFASGLDTLPGVKPLHNCRWALHRRAGGQWTRLAEDAAGRQREPCPLGVFDDGRLMLSVNPTLTPPDTYSGPADPHLLAFQARDPRRAPAAWRPAWSGGPRLTEHTYRGLAVDPRRREALVLHNDGTGKPRAHWALLDRRGATRAAGVVTYPIRGCYPQLALRNRQAHIFAVGDIVEPVVEWRKWKFEQSRREWDYVFRRLYYVRAAALQQAGFAEPLEVDNVDATAGHLTNLDLWLAPDGAAHLLYLKRRVASPALRDRFFPGVPLAVTLEHCVVAGGRVVARRTLLAGEEGGEVPVYARLHATASGRLLALATVRTGPRHRMRLLAIEPAGPALDLAAEHPLTVFMTATERGGSRAGSVIDAMGLAAGEPNRIRYALISLA